MADTRVVMNPTALAAFVRDGNGPVVRDLIVRAERVRVEARRLVGKKSGNLESRIVKRVVEIEGLPAVIVGVESVPYALWHHEGTRPHRIQGKPLLVFYWPKAGKVVYLRHVDHPGTKPNRFLVNALRVLR